MSSASLALFLFIYLFICLSFGFHECIHNQIDINLHQIEANYDGKRRLFTDITINYGTSPFYQAIRIHFDYSQIHNQDKNDLSKVKKVINAAKQYIENIIFVQHVSGNLKITKRNDCGTVNPIPQHHINVGVQNSDIIIYVTFGSDTRCVTLGDALAFAAACIIDQYGRPVVGYIHICKSNAFINNHFDKLVPTALHEMMHIFVMAHELWGHFIDPNTERKKQKSEIVKTVQYGHTPQGIIISQDFLISPNIVQKAKEHYNCYDIDGVALEVNAGSHFAVRALAFDIMVPFIRTSLVYFSVFDGALLEDSGHYKVNYDELQNYLWGKEEDCTFLFEPNCDQQSPQFFCKPNQYGCNHNYAAQGVCISNTLDTPPGVTLITDQKMPHQHRLQCPFMTPPGIDAFEFICWDPDGYLYDQKTQEEHNKNLVYYGEDSRCVTLEFDGTKQQYGHCMQHRCIDNGVEIIPDQTKPQQIITCHVGDKFQKRTFIDQQQKYAARTIHIICPNVKAICNNEKPFECFWGSYSSTLKRCVCFPGYVGRVCDKRHSQQTISLGPHVSVGTAQSGPYSRGQSHNMPLLGGKMDPISLSGATPNMKHLFDQQLQQHQAGKHLQPHQYQQQYHHAQSIEFEEQSNLGQFAARAATKARKRKRSRSWSLTRMFRRQLTDLTNTANSTWTIFAFISVTVTLLLIPFFLLYS